MAPTKTALVEASTLAISILKAIEGLITGQSGTDGAELQFLCGELMASAETEFAASLPITISTTPAPVGTFWGDFTACFDQAQIAGVTFEQFEILRILAEAELPITDAAIAVQNFSVRMVLVEESRILAATTFTSRDQIDGFIDTMRENFDGAILVAADNMDNVAYQALIALRGAVINDLSTRAIPLPRLVNYKLARRLPSLYLAQTIYQDASRNDEIVAFNDIIHPAFAPMQLRVLSQ
jgi:prophage DNA circulation protein